MCVEPKVGWSLKVFVAVEMSILLTLEPGLLLSLLLSLLHKALLLMLWGSQDLIKIRWTSVWLVFFLVLAVKILENLQLPSNGPVPFPFSPKTSFHMSSFQTYTFPYFSTIFSPPYNHVRFAWEDHPSNLEQQRCFDTNSPWEQSNKL